MCHYTGYLSSSIRIRLRKYLVINPTFSYVMISISVWNTIILMTNYYGASASHLSFIHANNIACAVLYIIELMLKIAIMGITSYLKDVFNIIDMVWLAFFYINVKH